jgi:type VI secretion system secreted protein Hcp
MAAVDLFLKIDGIEGESHDSKHKGEIQLESFSCGAVQMGTQSGGGGGGAGKVHIQDFHFVMKVNKASPKLLLACANGEHFPTAVLTCRKAGGTKQEYLKWTFSEILISSYHQSASSHGDIIPIDQVGINFGKVEVEYKEQKHDGSLGAPVKAGWDLKQNKPT